MTFDRDQSHLTNYDPHVYAEMGRREDERNSYQLRQERFGEMVTTTLAEQEQLAAAHSEHRGRALAEWRHEMAEQRRQEERRAELRRTGTVTLPTLAELMGDEQSAGEEGSARKEEHTTDKSDPYDDL